MLQLNIFFKGKSRLSTYNTQVLFFTMYISGSHRHLTNKLLIMWLHPQILGTRIWVLKSPGLKFNSVKILEGKNLK